MKRCPTCQRTYPDDAPDYCSSDGMRLVDEEAAGFDPEKTVLSSGMRTLESESPSTPPPPAPPPLAPPQQQYFAPEETPGFQQAPQPQQPWQPPPEQPSPQSPAGQVSPQNWSPSPPQPAQPWGTPYQGYAANVPYAPQGRSRALAIAALVTGACAVTIMSLLVFRDRDFVFTAMLILAILGLGLGVTALILALQKPSRFGGIPLAIAGLATGTAALVYYFTL
jgi:hypothetical protein